MVTVEDAINLQHVSAGFMAYHRHQLAADTIIYPHGLADVTQLSFVLAQASVYTWAKHIKRIVDESCANYPLDQAVGALHYFHHPCMFWVFDDPVLWIQPPATQRGEVSPDVDGPQAVDAILVAAHRRGQPRTTRELLERALHFFGGTAEERAQMAQEVRDTADGVEIIAFTSLRTGVPIEGPTGSVPPGSRLAAPIMVSALTFGRAAAEGEIVDSQLTDPTIHQEQTRLKQWVLAAAALMKQRILVATSQLATRGERKRLDAAQLSTAVMTIQLRATEQQPSEKSTSVIEWTHRWIVRGHWRQQWYSSQKEHRVLWIPAYIKGPGDQPLVIRPAVYAVTR